MPSIVKWQAPIDQHFILAYLRQSLLPSTKIQLNKDLLKMSVTECILYKMLIYGECTTPLKNPMSFTVKFIN
jgi:hypothetical protein